MSSLEVFAHNQACTPVVTHVDNINNSFREVVFRIKLSCLIVWYSLPLDVLMCLEQCGAAHQS
jgi:hypothetical protein